MTKVKLFWSNICILHKYEKEMLDKLAASLREREIDLEITYFGIGFPYRMAEYMSRVDSELPDLIVSTDLEVFEDRRIFSRISDGLIDLSGDFAVKEVVRKSAIGQWAKLLPFLIIPLVFCTNDQFAGNPEELSYDEILKEEGVVFGGINNSGAKSVIKTLWNRYGKERTREFVRKSQVQAMPINAFSQVRMGGAKLGITPSIYSKTADGKRLFRTYPAEGAIGLPSYICASDRLPKEIILTVLKGLLTKEFCEYFTEAGDLYCCLEDRGENSWVAANGEKFLYPDKEWFEQVSPEEFGDFYQKLVID